MKIYIDSQLTPRYSPTGWPTIFTAKVPCTDMGHLEAAADHYYEESMKELEAAKRDSIAFDLNHGSTSLFFHNVPNALIKPDTFIDLDIEGAGDVYLTWQFLSKDHPTHNSWVDSDEELCQRLHTSYGHEIRQVARIKPAELVDLSVIGRANSLAHPWKSDQEFVEISVKLDQHRKVMDYNEKNKMIAEFMGYIHSDDPNIRKYEEERFTYHSDWNELMRVVDKITSHVYERHENNDPSGNMGMSYDRAHLRTFGMIDDESGNYMVRINRSPLHLAPKLIDATYDAVVEWIERHNEQTKTE